VTSQPPAPIELRTSRLLLRRPRPDDVDAYLAIESDPEYAFFGSRDSVDRAGMERGLARIVGAPWDQHPEFAVVFEGQVVGRVALTVDRANATAALGYGILRSCWGRGIATEAARAAVDYAFEAFELAKVGARVDPRNIASVRVLEKLGMQLEGVLRSQLLRRGERVDRAYYGILREEWEAGRRTGR
jgi:ribosomal-protein-alanine N-acetyltransferase